MIHKEENRVTAITPHGGQLVNRLTSEGDKQNILEQSRSWKKIDIDEWTYADLECIAIGAFSPITGFMNEVDYQSVVTNMYLHSGEAWTIPITLAVENNIANELQYGEKICLCYNGKTVAILEVTDCYRPDKEREALCVYGTDDRNHPGVKRLLHIPDTYVGGPITLLERQPALFPA